MHTGMIVAAHTLGSISAILYYIEETKERDHTVRPFDELRLKCINHMIVFRTVIYNNMNSVVT